MKTYEYYRCANPYCPREADTRYVREQQKWITVTSKTIQSENEWTNPIVGRSLGIEGDYCSIGCLVEHVQEVEKAKK